MKIEHTIKISGAELLKMLTRELGLPPGATMSMAAGRFPDDTEVSSITINYVDGGEKPRDVHDR